MKKLAIREYSMTRDSTRQLSPSFRVREFACKGSDVVLIDDELVVLLQCIRCLLYTSPSPRDA